MDVVRPRACEELLLGLEWGPARGWISGPQALEQLVCFSQLRAFWMSCPLHPRARDVLVFPL